MKIALIIIGAIVLAAIALSIWSRLAYRRWRRRFDSLPPDEQRKEQEAAYRQQAYSNSYWSHLRARRYAANLSCDTEKFAVGY